MVTYNHNCQWFPLHLIHCVYISIPLWDSINQYVNLEKNCDKAQEKSTNDVTELLSWSLCECVHCMCDIKGKLPPPPLSIALGSFNGSKYVYSGLKTP